MTVQKVFIKNIYNGNGSNKTFPITFEWPTAHPEYIKVFVKDADGVMSAVTNFTITQSGSDWNVNYPTSGEALAKNNTLIIAREIPLIQILNLVNLGPYFAEDIELTFDEVVMMIQQLNEAVDRSAKFDISLNGDFDPTLPIKAGYGWRVSDDGKSIVELENPKKVYEDTVSVYDRAVRETNGIKNQAVAETNEIKEDVENLQKEMYSLYTHTADIRNEVSEIKYETAYYGRLAKDYSDTAQQWAESASAPDPRDSSTKSSKSWALLAEGNAKEAAMAASYCTAMAAEGAVFDLSHQYHAGEVAMTPDGALYRCLVDSIGEDPIASLKWGTVSVVINETFELDYEGDLTPLANPKASARFDIDDAGDIMPIL